jgi:integrase
MVILAQSEASKTAFASSCRRWRNEPVTIANSPASSVRVATSRCSAMSRILCRAFVNFKARRERHRCDRALRPLRRGHLTLLRWQDQDLVCARMHGTPISPNELTGAFAAVIRESDLPQIHFHDLRHSHATQLLRQGIHPKVVSERLGPSNIAITLDVYSHVLPDMQDEGRFSWC